MSEKIFYPLYMKTLAIMWCRIFFVQFAIQKFKDQDIKNYILPVVLYGFGTWSLTLRDECRLRVLENWVLRRIFGAKRNEVTRKWRKLHNEELNYQFNSIQFNSIHLYALPCMGDKIEKNEMGGACSVYGGEERHIQGFGRET